MLLPGFSSPIPHFLQAKGKHNLFLQLAFLMRALYCNLKIKYSKLEIETSKGTG